MQFRLCAIALVIGLTGCGSDGLGEWRAAYRPPTTDVFRESVAIQNAATDLPGLFFCTAQGVRFEIESPEYRNGAVCGQVYDIETGRRAAICVRPDDVAYIGMPYRRMVMGTSRGPGSCPEPQTTG